MLSESFSAVLRHIFGKPSDGVGDAGGMTILHYYYYLLPYSNGSVLVLVLRRSQTCPCASQESHWSGLSCA